MKKGKIQNELLLPLWEEMPDIGLYMDQVLVLMDKYIGRFLSMENKDGFITPSMINNYVKHGVMPAPKSKKYFKEHLAYLIIICLMKQALSISSIKSIIEIELKNSDIVLLYGKFCNIYTNLLKSITTSQDIALKSDLQNYNILQLGIISNICRIISDKEILNYEKLKEAIILDDNKKNKKEKKKEEKKA